MSKSNYTVGIGKGAALVQPTRQMVQLWQPGMSQEELYQAAITNGVFGPRSAYRAKDIVARVFSPRFLRPTNLPARCLKACVAFGLPNDVFADLILVFSARNDALLSDFLTKVFWPAARLNRPSLSISDAINLIEQGETDHRIIEPWSPMVKTKIARGLLGALRDCGYLGSERVANRSISKHACNWRSCIVLAAVHHFEGSCHQLAQQDWQCLGLREEESAQILADHAAKVGVVVQMGGGAMKIAWPAQTIEGVISGIA